jgi:RAB protein geranylgeranyltransferase component A
VSSKPQLRHMQLIYCSGLLVDTLLRSGAHSYVEFKAVEAVAVLQDGELRPVPSSRSDVFTSTQLSAADKRALMRTLKAATDAAAGGEATQPSAAAPQSPFSDGAHPSFDAALTASGLNATLRAAVIHALALLDTPHDVPVAIGLAALRRRVPPLQARFTLHV